ncbi:MotA/TolQ/ExbB proton channel family protein [bacterium]|nr:MotA/TolQ/ExbB proton channel family protein [bacterium]
MGIEIDVMQVFRSSVTLVVLLICSIVVLTVTLERWWVTRRNNVDMNWMLVRVRRYILENRFSEAITFLSKHKSSIAAVFREGIQKRTLIRSDMEEFLINVISGQNLILEKRLGILGTLGSMSPFIGLLGTVLGIVRAFHDLAAASGGGPSVVANGIAEALVATAAGLVVAIPALMFFNYFSNKVRVINANMEMAARSLILLIYAKEQSRDGAKY